MRMSLILREGTLAIFPGFRRLLDAFSQLTAAVQSLASAQRYAAPAIERLEALELSRHQFEAQMEGLYLKAEGKLKAAANAEARERQLKKSYEANADQFDTPGDPEPVASPILPGDVERGEAERLSALHLDVAPNNKTAALTHKWRR